MPLPKSKSANSEFCQCFTTYSTFNLHTNIILDHVIIFALVESIILSDSGVRLPSLSRIGVSRIDFIAPARVTACAITFLSLSEKFL